MHPLTLDRPIDRLREDRTPLVAARRRASVLATLGVALLLTAVAATLVGRGAGPQITLVTPQSGAADVAAGPSDDARAVVGASCGPRADGQIRYDVRFDDGTRAARTAVPEGRQVTIDADGPTGLPFPDLRLELARQADGTWSCAPRYG
jgi:hypothetical protein